MQLKNIIFDLGGVLIPLNIKATTDGFKKLGAKNFELVYSKREQQHFFDQFDKGLITDNEFRAEIKKYVNKEVTFEQIDETWNLMLGITPQSRIDFLKTVKEQFKIYLLSNTNSIHVKKFEADHLSKYHEDIFKTHFIKSYYSCNMGMRKPDVEIFNAVINSNNLNAAETIFIDDSIQHIEGATSAGLKAHYLDLNRDTVETLFKKVIS